VRPRLRAAHAREAKIDTVAVDGFGFGGQNAVTIFRRVVDYCSGATPSAKCVALERLHRLDESVVELGRAADRVVVPDEHRFADRDESRMTAGLTRRERCSSTKLERPMRVARTRP
jgi:hypothetical protein